MADLKNEKQEKLVYFNRTEVLQQDGNTIVELLDKKDEDELFRLKEIFEKRKQEKTVKNKEVKK